MPGMANRSKSWRTFFILYPLLALVPIGVLTAFSLWSLTNRLNSVTLSEGLAVELQREAVAAQLQVVVKDLCLLAQQNELAALLLGDTPEARLAMAAEYLALSRNSGLYDQIRYLNRRGQEVVRVNFRGGDPFIVGRSDLQDKSNRYYFADSMALEPGQIYVSPLDLNVEHGRIEIPHKPMIRLGTPVEDPAGRRRGVILINYMAEHMLDQVEAAGSVSLGRPMMLNDQGYWLVTPDPPPGWGFMFPDRAEARMQEVFPEVWEQMIRAPKGVIRSPEGLFSFVRYDPVNRLKGCFERADGRVGAVAYAGYPWVLASHVPESVIQGWRRGVILHAVLIGVPVLLLLAVGTRAVLLVVGERRRHREHLEALARFDTLTGLANRTTFEERLREEILRSKRHRRRLAMLYIDLDGFKQINDAMGHETGDQVLTRVAEALKSCCRATDLAARHGGDEFVVLLAEVADASVAHAIAEKIRSRIEALSWGDLGVGASIGVALWPDDCPDGDEHPQAVLLRQADAAMYRAKLAGKNRISGCSS